MQRRLGPGAALHPGGNIGSKVGEERIDCSSKGRFYTTDLFGPLPLLVGCPFGLAPHIVVATLCASNKAYKKARDKAASKSDE